MKQLYVVFFFFISSLVCAQQLQGNGDIDGFKLYPNPTINGKIFIDTANNDPKEINVFDVLGTMVLQTTLLGKELYVGDLDKGVYILRVTENGNIATRKLVIK